LEAYLAKSLDSGNVVRRAMLADECSADNLKTSCVSCIAADNSVFKSLAWEDLQKKLAVELLTRVMFPDDDEFPALMCSMSLEAETSVVHEKLFPVPDAVCAISNYCADGDYASKVGNESVAMVFQLAGEYLMGELKSAMEKRLIKNLSTANVVETACFLVVFQSSAWKNLMKKKLELAVELQYWVTYHDDESPTLECPSRKDMVEKRNERIWRMHTAEGMDIHDCLFKIGEEMAFKCQKCFLVAHSPNLREMLIHPMSLD